MIVPTLASCASTVLIFLGVVNGQSLRNIIVDDTDPAITYLGFWNNGTGESGYYGFGHRSSTERGATATFTFNGVAVYYMMGLAGNDVTTLLTLDSGPAQWVNLSVGSGSGRSAVRWSATGLANGKHTLVNSFGRSAKGEVANWGEVDAFIYTVQDPGGNPVKLTSDDPRITYNPPGAWTTNSTEVPSCALSKSGVRVSSTKDATFSFNFTGDTIFLHTINSPMGGKYSLSINGGPEQMYDTHANSTDCGTSPPMTVSAVKVRRDSLARRADQNTCTGKNIGGTVALDGISYENSKTSSARGTISTNGKFCAGTILFISYLLLHGIF